jgi:DNA-binding response OmpR family regulator
MAGRILVLEDDEHVLRMVQDMLRDEGYEAIGLRYPELVLDVVAQEEPDLVLIDVMLPKRSGIEVADQLWTNGFGATPIIAMSASTIMLDLARGTPFFQEVVRKPFDMDALLGDVRRVLSEHRPTLALPPVRT